MNIGFNWYILRGQPLRLQSICNYIAFCHLFKTRIARHSEVKYSKLLNKMRLMLILQLQLAENFIGQKDD